MSDTEFKTVNKALLDFISRSPSCFHVVSSFSRLLIEEGFEELRENQPWNLEKGRCYFVTPKRLLPDRISDSGK